MSKPDRMPRAGRAARYTSGPLPSGGGRWHADGFDPVPREPTALHAQRLQAVHEAIRAAGGGRVADMGCGDGAPWCAACCPTRRSTAFLRLTMANRLRSGR